MKILLALCRPLYPLDMGGKIRTLNVFVRLGNQAEVHAVSLADRGRDGQSVEQMREVFCSYEPVFWKEPAKFSAAFYWRFLLSRVSRFPYSLAKYRVPKFQLAVESKYRRENFDVLVCDGLPSAAALLECRVRPRVVFERNVEYMILKRQYDQATNPILRFLLRGEWRKTYEIEREVCLSFDHVVAVSELDRETFRSEFQTPNVSAIPTGVDVSYFHPSDRPQQSGNIAFVGSMDWYPNEDGILWFLRGIYPQVRKTCPHASLTVVGRSPSGRMREYSATDPTIEITGRVDDVRPYLARAEVVIVPLRIGSGTRIKIFEAMAMARPVVSTTIGAEGLPVTPGIEILIADEAREFAAAVGTLLSDRSKRDAIGQAARETVVQQYAWEVPARKLLKILEGVSPHVREGRRVSSAV